MNRDQVRPLLKFGLPLAGASIVVFAIGFADQIVVGKMLGPTMLGFYVLAFNLSQWPIMVFSQPLRNVAPATFSRLQHEPEAMRSAFRGLIGLLAAVAFPVCLLLSGAAGADHRDRLRLRLGAGRGRARLARRARRVQDPLRARLRLPGRDRRARARSWCCRSSRWRR